MAVLTSQTVLNYGDLKKKIHIFILWPVKALISKTNNIKNLQFSKKTERFNSLKYKYTEN